MTITVLLDSTMRNEVSAGLFEVSGEQIGGSRDSHNGLGEKNVHRLEQKRVRILQQMRYDVQTSKGGKSCAGGLREVVA